MADTQVSNNSAVIRELQGRGVDQATGTFGNHTVRLSGAKPLRIDKIKPDRIPFQGFRTATRIARGAEGLGQAAAKTLSVLTQSGKLDARALLGAIRTAHEYTQRLGKLGTDAPSSALELFAPHVEGMTNLELAKAYQMLATTDADLLMTALVHEGRSNPEASDARRCAETLFDLQALLLKEVRNRASRAVLAREAEKEPGNADLYAAMAPKSLTEQYAPLCQGPLARQAGGDLGSGAMTALVEVAANSATARGKGAAETSAMIKGRKFGIFSPKEAGDMLRAA